VWHRSLPCKARLKAYNRKTKQTTQTAGGDNSEKEPGSQPPQLSKIQKENKGAEAQLYRL